MTMTRINFTRDDIRAYQAGRKTMARRVIKTQPPHWHWYTHKTPDFNVQASLNDAREYWVKCPYGYPGYLLLVRETWNSDQEYAYLKPSEIPEGAPIYYRADMGEPDPDGVRPIWRPSIFMPRWASRFILEIVSVKVERIQDITEEDARKEGIYQLGGVFESSPNHAMGSTARDAFMWLWESNHGKGAWSRNEWVWVVEFEGVGR